MIQIQTEPIYVGIYSTLYVVYYAVYNLYSIPILKYKSIINIKFYYDFTICKTQDYTVAWCLLHKKWSELVFLSTHILYCTVQHSEHCTVLKSRTFSVVNAWVLRGHCDRLRNFLTPGAKWLVQHSIPFP